jgi:uncharacterized protein YraI
MRKTTLFSVMLFAALLLLMILPVNTLNAQGGVTVETTTTVRLRSGPGTTYPVVASIPPKTTLNIEGRSANRQWVQVNFNGAVGWLSVSLGKVNGDLNSVQVINVPTPISPAVIRRQTQQLCVTNAAIAGAPNYDGSPGTHPVIVLRNKGGTHPFNGSMRGINGANPQIAACLGDQTTETIETCPYVSLSSDDESTITRKVQFIDVRVIVILTGQQIGSTRLVGSTPGECKPVELFRIGQKNIDRVGGAVAAKQLLDYLTPFAKK